MAYQKIEPYCMRQMHWHANDEIAYVISGNARAGIVGPGGIKKNLAVLLWFVRVHANQQPTGQNSSFFNVSAGDAWFFPQGFLQYQVFVYFTPTTLPCTNPFRFFL